MAIEASTSKGVARRIRLGMVGGGQGAFIGAVHRIAARMDDRYELVAGAQSRRHLAQRSSGRLQDDFRAIEAADVNGKALRFVTKVLPKYRNYFSPDSRRVHRADLHDARGRAG